MQLGQVRFSLPDSLLHLCQCLLHRLRNTEPSLHDILNTELLQNVHMSHCKCHHQSLLSLFQLCLSSSLLLPCLFSRSCSQTHFCSQPFFLSLSCSFSLVQPWSLCLLACSSFAWPSGIVSMCHWPIGAVEDEVYCCGLEAGSSSGVRGGRGSNCGTALPLIAAIDSNLCTNMKEASQDFCSPRQVSIS